MKLRVLAFGENIQHKMIDILPEFVDPRSLGDYDAFIFDPAQMFEEFQSRFAKVSPRQHIAGNEEISQQYWDAACRRRAEISAFIHQKGGLVICLLRPIFDKYIVEPQGGKHVISVYSAFDSVRSHGLYPVPLDAIRAGKGSQFALLKGHDVIEPYFQVLSQALEVEAHFERTDNMESIAVNPLGQSISTVFSGGAGRIFFVPVPLSNADPRRIGSAIVECVRRYYGGTLDVEVPGWAAAISVPNAQQFDVTIDCHKQQLKAMQGSIDELEEKRDALNAYKRLLYGTGTAVLETIVRQAFRLLGFSVPDPDEYEEEWDAVLREDDRYAIVEIEGPEGAIDLAKYRQLRDYVDDEITTGKTPKGILVGNGYRLLPIDSNERTEQFTEAAVRGGTKQEFALVPTTELFKAVCAVLRNDDLALKAAIRQSLFETIGVWKFIEAAVEPEGCEIVQTKPA
jgi:hypothetical protein